MMGSSFEIRGNHNQVIVMGEHSNGNESVGDMWFDTATFDADSKLREVLEWAVSKGISGKLIIAVGDSMAKSTIEGGRE